MTGHHAREGHRLRVREVIGSQRDIFGTFDVEWQCEGVLPVRSTSSGSVGGTATRARACSSMWLALPLGPERAAPHGRHCHSGLSVQFRVEDTATRAWAHRFGTFDVEWQCGRRYPVRSPP